MEPATPPEDSQRSSTQQRRPVVGCNRQHSQGPVEAGRNSHLKRWKIGAHKQQESLSYNGFPDVFEETDAALRTASMIFM